MHRFYTQSEGGTYTPHQQGAVGDGISHEGQPEERRFFFLFTAHIM